MVATNKKRKFVSTPGTTSAADDDAPLSSSGTTLSLPRPPSSVSYWESGESRKLFAPKALHGMDCDVRKIVLDRVEKLESINRYDATEWMALVDGGDPDDLCSEHDIFLLRHRSLYLACALRKFGTEATGDGSRRWTWQLCLEHAIQSMNDIGIKTYSNWRTLARWHR